MRLAGVVVLGQPESSRAERNRDRSRDFFMVGFWNGWESGILTVLGWRGSLKAAVFCLGGVIQSDIVCHDYLTFLFHLKNQ